jgi:hypothetical protein
MPGGGRRIYAGLGIGNWPLSSWVFPFTVGSVNVCILFSDCYVRLHQALNFAGATARHAAVADGAAWQESPTFHQPFLTMENASALI